MLKQLFFYPLFNLLVIIMAFIPGHDFGIAIIILTLIVQLALYPLLKKQLHHQKAIRELQPEVKKVKKKAKGDKEKEAQLLMELYKEKEVNPLSSIGVSFLQFPFLIGLFYVLRGIVENENFSEAVYGFLQNTGFISRLIENPEIFDPTLLGLVNLAEPSTLLAVLAGLAQFLQARTLSPQNLMATDEDKKRGNAMTMIFPIITVVFALNFPGALALYWITRALLSAGQQTYILRQDADEMSEEADKTEGDKDGRGE